MTAERNVYIDHTGRPSLNVEDSATGARLQMFFGYKDGEPTVAIFKEEDLEPVLILPKEILDIAVEHGWDEHGNKCPHCSEGGARLGWSGEGGAQLG